MRPYQVGQRVPPVTPFRTPRLGGCYQSEVRRDALTYFVAGRVFHRAA